MLDVEEPVVKRGELPGFCMPGFCAWIGRVDGEMHDFWNTRGPFLDEANREVEWYQNFS